MMYDARLRRVWVMTEVWLGIRLPSALLPSIKYFPPYLDCGNEGVKLHKIGVVGVRGITTV